MFSKHSVVNVIVPSDCFSQIHQPPITSERGFIHILRFSKVRNKIITVKNTRQNSLRKNKEFLNVRIQASLIVQVAHDLFILGTITRHNIAIRVDEESIKAHVARQQTLLTIDIVDQTVIKVSTEPLLRAITAEQFVDQILKVLSKSVMLLRPLTCHIPVSPGLVARRAR